MVDPTLTKKKQKKKAQKKSKKKEEKEVEEEEEEQAKEEEEEEIMSDERGADEEMEGAGVESDEGSAQSPVKKAAQGVKRKAPSSSSSSSLSTSRFGCRKVGEVPMPRIRKIAQLDPDVGPLTRESIALVKEATDLFMNKLIKQMTQHAQQYEEERDISKGLPITFDDLDHTLATSHMFSFLRFTLRSQTKPTTPASPTNGARTTPSNAGSGGKTASRASKNSAASAPRPRLSTQNRKGSAAPAVSSMNHSSSHDNTYRSHMESHTTNGSHATQNTHNRKLVKDSVEEEDLEKELFG